MVAQDLGGVLVEDAVDADTRVLLNVVEEMAIASGIGVPPVYVLESDGINAFAAGYDAKDAVIGITRGAIQSLNREQLQGVVAHEFSHIFNGDMRLNMRMLGLLHGVLCISLMAKLLMELGSQGLRRPRGAHLALLLMAVGAVVWCVGIAGSAVSLLVKAATNRQREFLADAFAVQFTRNPEGLASAMKLIAGHQSGSRVRGPKALEASHMFFAEGCGKLASLLASHPPIVQRIRRLDPEWDGVPFFVDDQREMGEYQGAFRATMGLVSGGDPVQLDASNLPQADTTASIDGDRFDKSPQWQVKDIARLESNAYVQEQQAGFPDALVDFIQCPVATPLVLATLWIAHSRRHAHEAILERFEGRDRQRLAALLPAMHHLNEAQHVMLFDDAVSRIPALPDSARQALAGTHQRLAPWTEEHNMFHWMWKVVLASILKPADDACRRSRYGQLEEVAGACEFVLSTVCHEGAEQEAMASFAFQRGLASLGISHVGLLPKENCTWENFETAMEVTRQLTASSRRQLLLACTAALTSDRVITPTESYTLRGICAELDFEVPSLLPGQPLPAGV